MTTPHEHFNQVIAEVRALPGVTEVQDSILVPAIDFTIFSEANLHALLEGPAVQPAVKESVRAELKRRAGTKAPEKASTHVTPESGTRLDQLLARYDELFDAFEAAKELFEGIKDAIKHELTTGYQHAREGDGTEEPYDQYTVAARSLRAPLTLTYVERTTTDTKALDAAHPGLRAQFAKKTGSWTLKGSK